MIILYIIYFIILVLAIVLTIKWIIMLYDLRYQKKFYDLSSEVSGWITKNVNNINSDNDKNKILNYLNYQVSLCSYDNRYKKNIIY